MHLVASAFFVIYKFLENVFVAICFFVQSLTHCGLHIQKVYTITNSVLISCCFALYPYEKQELIKPE